jgi:hypothetical protein
MFINKSAGSMRDEQLVTWELSQDLLENKERTQHSPGEGWGRDKSGEGVSRCT